jgi:GNAT superfamily N-acetyltransferase
VTTPRVQPRHDLSAVEIEDLEDRLYAFNSHATGRADGEGLGFTILGEDGRLIGAVAGYSWAGMVELRQVWVEEGRRGEGLGRALVEAALAEASARGCDRVFVMSYAFQAPGLYERCGFARVAQIEGWPPGHSHVVLRRDLPNAADGAP